jgi:uncharacterized protein (DUF1800 family)
MRLRGVLRRALPGVLGLLSVGLLPACGGGGGGGGGGGPSVPPVQSVSYPVPVAAYEQGQPIAANVPVTSGGPVDEFTVSPSLPTGLVLDGDSGVVSGTPDATAPATDHVVRAVNEAGFAETVLRIEVVVSLDESLTAKSSFTDDDIRYFLYRTHFGGTASEFDAVQAAGIPAYVDAMVEFADTTTLETEAFQFLRNDTDPAGLEGGFPSQSQVSRYWLHLMVTNPNPFQEVLAFFWHDHFASSTASLENTATRWMVDQVNLWRKKGNANLRTLLLDMCRDWTMLVWLDNVLNTKSAPNENFTREFWELFTLGVDQGYTQQDIVLAAKAFTGYRTRFNATTNQSYVAFDTARHDPGPKTILGVQIPGQNVTDDFEAVVDITIDNRPVAEFIAKRLFSYFGHADPADALVASMGQLLRDSDYEMKPLLKALFKSEAFFGAKSRAGIPKNPVEHMLGFVRSTGLVPVDPRRMTDPAYTPANRLVTLEAILINAAQRPTQPPSVNGWPIGSEWLSAQNMLDRANGVLLCIADRTDQATAGIDLTAILPPVAERTSAAVTDTLAALLNVHMTAAERASYITYLDTTIEGGVVVASPFDGSNAQHLSNRVRGLLYILSQHPSYAVR